MLELDRQWKIHYLVTLWCTKPLVSQGRQNLVQDLETPGTSKEIRQFIWLEYRGKILTNLERKRRGLTANPHCKICTELIEDLNHLFRKCPVVTLFWNKVAGPMGTSKWKALPSKEWMSWNTSEADSLLRESPGEKILLFVYGSFENGGLKGSLMEQHSTCPENSTWPRSSAMNM